MRMNKGRREIAYRYLNSKFLRVHLSNIRVLPVLY